MNKDNVKHLVLQKFHGTKSGDDYINYYKQTVSAIDSTFPNLYASLPINLTDEEAADFIYNFLCRDMDTARNLMSDIKNQKLSLSYQELLTEVKRNTELSSKIIQQQPQLLKLKFENSPEINVLNFKKKLSVCFKHESLSSAIQECHSIYSELFSMIYDFKLLLKTQGHYYLDTNNLMRFITLSSEFIDATLKYGILLNNKYSIDDKRKILTDLINFLIHNTVIIYNEIYKHKSKALLYKEKNKIDTYSDYVLRYNEFLTIKKMVNDINYILKEDNQGNTIDLTNFTMPDIKSKKFMDNFHTMLHDDSILYDNALRHLENTSEYTTALYELYVNKAKCYQTVKFNSGKKSLRADNRKGKLAKTIVLNFIDADYDSPAKTYELNFLNLKIVRGYFRDYGIIDLYPSYNKFVDLHQDIFSNCLTTHDDIFIYKFIYDIVSQLLHYILLSL